MNNFIKTEWGLVALEKCAQRAIEGGYVEPSITNPPSPTSEPEKGYIKIITVLWLS